MKHIYPLPVHHSWPLYERERHFELGRIHELQSLDAIERIDDMEAALGGCARPGFWECDLSDNSLNWSREVYDIFGIPDGAAVKRTEAAALYAEESRTAMEKLRAYAIRHRRGFTLDAEIRPAQGSPRWMRLIAAPLCVGDRIAKLQGLKFLVPARS